MANLQLFITTEEDLPMNDARIPPRTSARPKCTYREDTILLKHIEDENLALD
jgi:hypothetical protein